MRCKRDWSARRGRDWWHADRALEKLEWAKKPLSKDELAGLLGGGPQAYDAIRSAVTRGLIEPLPDGRYRAIGQIRPPPWPDRDAHGNGPRVAPAHAKHVRRHRPGVREAKP